jgi:hypothetical protein
MPLLLEIPTLKDHLIAFLLLHAKFLLALILLARERVGLEV